MTYSCHFCDNTDDDTLLMQIDGSQGVICHHCVAACVEHAAGHQEYGQHFQALLKLRGIGLMRLCGKEAA